MAESPIKITQSDDGLSVRCEFDAHYVSDEDAKRIRGYIDQLQAENAKLRELVRALATRLAYADRVVDGGVMDARLVRELRELGIEVSA